MRSRRNIDATFSPAQIDKVSSLISSDLGKRVTNRAMAKALGISVAHIPGMVYEAFGMSIQLWSLRQRCFAAAELLITTRLPVADVATQAGFHSHARLTHAFVKVFGITPFAYRRNVAQYEEAKAALQPFQSGRVSFQSRGERGASNG